MRRAISFKSIAPYALLAPGLIWLAIFFIYPAIQMFLVSLWTGNVQDGFQQTWNWGIYPEAFQEYWPWIGRSIVYGGLATILAFALGFPLAYAIAFRGGRLQEPPAVPRHRPVLHELPAANPVLEDHLLGRRDLPRSAQDHRDPPGRFPAAGHAGSRHRRHHLQLPAVHDAAPLRRAREDRSAASRGGRGPLRRTVAAARDVRRGHPGRAARRRGRRGHGLRPDRPGRSRVSSRVRSSARGSSARRSSGSPCPSRRRASSPAPCSCSSPRSATTSTPSCSGTRSR